ncbi:hypothetical protein [Ruthenibacterium lactatiformans]|uniref:hypothetical protein n=1 Tax=Ruthenibacterium lactatiformans TaxID=1550024 RepID=UPI003AB75B6C
MNVILVMSLFWIGYGIVGLIGFQNIPEKYKGHSWTKDYIRKQGITWIILGLPWFGFYLVRTFPLSEINISTGNTVVILIMLSIPALIGSIVLERKYKALLSAEIDSKPIE